MNKKTITTATKILIIDLIVLLITIPIILLNYYFIGSKIIMKILCYVIVICIVVLQIEALFNGKLKEWFCSEH